MIVKDVPFTIVNNADNAMNTNVLKSGRWEIPAAGRLWKDQFEKTYGVKFVSMYTETTDLIYRLRFNSEQDYLMFMLKWAGNE